MPVARFNKAVALTATGQLEVREEGGGEHSCTYSLWRESVLCGCWIICKPGKESLPFLFMVK